MKMATFWTQSRPAPSAFSEHMKLLPNKWRRGYRRKK